MDMSGEFQSPAAVTELQIAFEIYLMWSFMNCRFIVHVVVQRQIINFSFRLSGLWPVSLKTKVMYQGPHLSKLFQLISYS